MQLHRLCPLSDLQVVVEAVRTLSTCFLAVPAQENAALNGAASDATGTDAPHALSVVAKNGALLHESLTKARYHQIKHCRDVASEALGILKSMLPAVALRSAPPEKRAEKTVAKKASTGASRKGPWLHQKPSVGAEEAQSFSTPSRTPPADPSPTSSTLAIAQRCAADGVSSLLDFTRKSPPLASFILGCLLFLKRVFSTAILTLIHHAGRHVLPHAKRWTQLLANL